MLDRTTCVAFSGADPASSLHVGRRAVAVTPRSTEFYRNLVAMFDDRRRELGWSFAVLDAKTGVQNGYSAKAFRPDTKSGRIMTWPTVQLYLQTLWAGEGYRLYVVPDQPRRISGAPDPTSALFAALALAGVEGRRAIKALLDAGIEFDSRGRIVHGDAAEHRRWNRRRRMRPTIEAKVTKEARITAGQ